MVLVCLALTAVASVLLHAVKTHLLSQIDQSLVNGATYTVSRLAHHDYVPNTSPADQMGQAFLPNGRLIGSSANLEGQPPLIQVHAGVVKPQFMTVFDPRFGHIRVLEWQIGSSKGPVLVSGQVINQIFAAEHSLTVLLVVVLPALGVGLAVLIWIVVGRAMRRVEDIRSAVADISVRRLDERVPSSRSGDELDRLVETMNDMLDRLQGGIRRERQFVADASHELRSPIAALHAALEVEGPDIDGIRRGHRTALSELQRLEVLADDLLTVNSVEGARAGPPARLIDLDELVVAQAEQLRKRSSLEVDISDVSAGQVQAREIDMMRVIENLSSNAARYANARVAYSLRQDDDRVTLSVSDDGPGIPEPMRHEIFERFARVESDRGHNGGTGLGLAIVSELVRAYQGRVWVETAEPSGARFLVQLPAAN
jgi:signal transduction histidine kinase